MTGVQFSRSLVHRCLLRLANFERYMFHLKRGKPRWDTQLSDQICLLGLSPADAQERKGPY